MKIFLFIALLALAAFIGAHVEDVSDDIAKICTSLVAGAIFLLAFWLPGKIVDKEK